MAGPIVASRTLHPAPPESYTVFLAGCNFKCLNCQNWTISQFPDNGIQVEGYLDPEFLARESIHRLNSLAGKAIGADRIFFSGGEPTIHLPYLEQVVAEARRLEPTCRVNFDTNGFMTVESLQRVLNFTTSITFDLKAFEDETHRALTGAPVDPVLRNAEIVATRAPEKLWEFRIVVIPGMNEYDIPSLCRFLAKLSPDLPVCFLAFRPNFLLEGHPGASAELMRRCLHFARGAGLKNVTWAGRPDIPGEIAPVDPEMAQAYASKGSKTAATYARAGGCTTHPRNCSGCPSNYSSAPCGNITL